MHWLGLFFVVFQGIQCLLNFTMMLVGRARKFIVFSFVSYMHIHMLLRMFWPRLFFVVFQETQCLHIFNHDDVCHVTELYLSMFVLRLVRYMN